MNKFAGILNNTICLGNLFREQIFVPNTVGNLFGDDNVIVQCLNRHTIYFWGNVYIEGKTEEKALHILTNFVKQGIASFKLLDGEFTFAIYSPEEVIICRDRHGAGPQVYYNNDFYSSALKDFLLLKDFTPEPDIEALYHFLSYGYIPTPMCSLKGIKKLPAGCVLLTQSDKQTVETLFTWEDYCSSTKNISEEEATLQYKKLHKEAILHRVNGANKVGLLLSGGYDSAGNISTLREVYNGEAFSYTIGFKDNPWTELPLAKILSEKYGTIHHEYEINGSEIVELPEMVEYLGDPFQEGGLMVNYAAMKLIGNEKPDIILGGDGNDQHFGDAGKELALNFLSQKYGIKNMLKLYAQTARLNIFNNDNILFRTQFYNNRIINAFYCSNFGFQQTAIKKLVNEKIPKNNNFEIFPIPDIGESFNNLYKAHNYADNIKHIIDQVILFKASKMAQMFGNSLSFPYMSTDIYNFLKTMPREYKHKGSIKDLAKGQGVSKFLHKNYLKDKLPNEITERKKQGGFAPLPIFFKNELQRKKLKKFIFSSSAVKNLFSEKELFLFFQIYDKQAQNNGYWFWYKQVKAFQFFNLLVLSVWWEIFISKKTVQEIKNQLI